MFIPFNKKYCCNKRYVKKILKIYTLIYLQLHKRYKMFTIINNKYNKEDSFEINDE